MRTIFTTLILALSFAASAQTNETTPKRFNIFSNIGLSWIDKSYKPVSGASVQTTTGLAMRLSNRSSIGAQLSFASYRYEKSSTFYNLDGSLKTSALGLFYRFKLTTGSWQPYLKAGGGTAWITLPVVTAKQGVTNIEKTTQNVGMALAEAGFQIRVHPRYSIQLAAERKWMGKSSLADNTALRATGVKIGLVSAF